MARIVLTIGCVGKTYADARFCNVYDFDKHTLDYKYDRTGYEHLSDEQFKSIPGRTIKPGWFTLYMQDWCALIDRDEYDVVLGWLNQDCVDYLLERGYELELLLVDPAAGLDVYRERSRARGNSEVFWGSQEYWYRELYRVFMREPYVSRLRWLRFGVGSIWRIFWCGRGRGLSLMCRFLMGRFSFSRKGTFLVKTQGPRVYARALRFVVLGFSG